MKSREEVVGKKYLGLEVEGFIEEFESRLELIEQLQIKTTKLDDSFQCSHLRRTCVQFYSSLIVCFYQTS